jgi:hypothetical protein
MNTEKDKSVFIGVYLWPAVAADVEGDAAQ